jgi:hypothetical protein
LVTCGKSFDVASNAASVRDVWNLVEAVEHHEESACDKEILENSAVSVQLQVAMAHRREVVAY